MSNEDVKVWSWVKITERLPEEHKECFILEVMDRDNPTDVVVWVGARLSNKFIIFSPNNMTSAFIDIADVLYWAEIPDTPQQTKR